MFLNGFTIRSQDSNRFPSPVGELCFSISNRHNDGYVSDDVSVPCRGAMFLNCDSSYRVANISVSVPCRGAMFLNNNLLYSSFQLILFPSPVGELCFSIGKYNTAKVFTDNVSVPCRGTMFLNDARSLIRCLS